jgi:hypothetical protein
MGSSCLADRGDTLGMMRRALHDLSNHLTLVVGGAALLADSPDLGNEARDLVAAVLDGAECASRLAAEMQRAIRTGGLSSDLSPEV